MLVEGWVTKMGAVVRNWKMRFMILQADGTLLYVSAGAFRAGSGEGGGCGAWGWMSCVRCRRLLEVDACGASPVVGLGAGAESILPWK